MYFQNDDLEKLPQKKKIYFTASCVERVVQIFEFNYDNTILVPRDIVEGIINDLILDNIDSSKAIKQKEILSDLIPNVDEMGSEFTPSMLAGVAILHFINCIISYKDEEIIHALEYSLQAVDSFSEYNGLGLDEEKAWHKKSLDIIQKNETYPVEEIKKINDEYPKWSEMWRD